jgi:phage shock protein PspC (stress-responsive transcriptional regulator)
MRLIVVIGFVSAIFFSLLTAFPRYFLTKISYKQIDYPDDYESKDIRFFVIIFGLFMAASWAVLFYGLAHLS